MHLKKKSIRLTQTAPRIAQQTNKPFFRGFQKLFVSKVREAEAQEQIDFVAGLNETLHLVDKPVR